MTECKGVSMFAWGLFVVRGARGRLKGAKPSGRKRLEVKVGNYLR